jgi:hypothetical protein
MPTAETVNEDASTMKVTSSANPVVYGQPVTFTANVTANAPGSGTPTGTVTFYLGATLLGTGSLSSGTATFITSSPLTVGSHSIKAYYGGDTNFKVSSGTVSQAVSKDGTTIAMESSTNPSVFGQSVVFTATISSNAPGSGVPTGTVTFMDATTTLATVALSSGTASYSTAKLTTAAHSITATYNGSGSYVTSAANLTQIVSQDATTTDVASSLNPSTYGQAVTFTATVTASSPGGGVPSGMVTFYDGQTSIGAGTLSKGKATLKTSSLPAGVDSITAVYGGDTNFVTSTITAPTQTVNQDATTTRLTSSANPSAYGQSVTFTATVTASTPGSGTPTGTVTFYVNSKSVGTFPLVSALASYTTTFAAAGTYTIKAVYSGDTNFKTSSATLTQTITVAVAAAAVVRGSPGSAVAQILGTLQDDRSGSSLIDDLASEIVATRNRSQRTSVGS